MDREALDSAVETLRNRLLAARSGSDHWEGHLSSSALSTSVAAFALGQVDGEEHASLICRGLEWLSENHNVDGGWGDTVESPSNLSTTLLCYSAMSMPKRPACCDASVKKAEAWLREVVGSLEPQAIAEGVDSVYGKDKTFSAPILTMCVLAGRLGSGPEVWRLIKPLPFELAVLPNRLYKWLRLPVVSYALPALIAIGQVHFTHCRVRNPLTRAVRFLARERSLTVLGRIQPENGGFLEAAPLTAFVTMSLAASGQKDHKVTREGVDFLVSSVRDDGSWPIDTNLATWVTTLAVNALAAGDIGQSLSASAQKQILQWLLDCQHNNIHPYTGAKPGGWAWSNLSGAVPDGDDTSGTLIALQNLGAERANIVESAAAGIGWLLGLQNGDGGIPTFCRGWTSLPFDTSAPDITAHALGGMGRWLDALPPDLQHKTGKSMSRAMEYLGNVQRDDGSWIPLWFGNQMADGHENPVYGTARVLSNLAQMPQQYRESFAEPLERAVQWLLSAQNADGGWGGAQGIASSIEETALAVDALSESLLIKIEPIAPDCVRSAIGKGAAWLISRVQNDNPFEPSPIGLYFASLWYSEELYPLVFSLSALSKAQKALRAS
jgi:squalene-hopene/tetraprenyl-beta-curcumene cyclase